MRSVISLSRNITTCTLLLCTLFYAFNVELADARLVIAKGNGLSLYNLNSSKWNDLYYGDSVPYSVDYLTTADGLTHLFWSDIKHYKINSGLLVNETLTNVTSLRLHDVGMIENIAVDWISGNIYWVVTSPGRIDVARVDGTEHSTVVSNIGKPRALALDPEAGLMFWSDLNEKAPCIERAYLSGRQRVAIKRFLPHVNKNRKNGWINAITLDRENKQIYWVDAKSNTIEVSSYDGNDHRVLIQDNVRLAQSFSLVLVSDSLFWSDLSLMAIIQANVKNLSSSAMSFVLESAQPVFGFKNLDVPRLAGDSELDDCSCTHLCLKDSPGKHRCLCPFGMIVAKNERSCTVPSTMLLTVSLVNNNLPAIFTHVPGHSNESLFPPLILNKYSRVLSVSFDYSRRLFAWLDAYDSKVHYHSHKKSGSLAVSPDSTSVSLSQSGDVYVSEAGENPCISLCSLSSGVCVPLVFEGIHLPTHLTLLNSHLIWLESSSSLQIFSITNMTRSILYSGTRMCCATIDPLSQLLYWMSDSKISRRRLDGSNSQSWIVEGLDKNSTLVAVVDEIAYFNMSLKGLVPYDLNLGKWLPIFVKEPIIAATAVLLKRPLASSYKHLQKYLLMEDKDDLETSKTAEVEATTADSSKSTSAPICSINCLNSGFCVRLSNGIESCNCPIPYAGRRCEIYQPELLHEDNKLECGCINGDCSVVLGNLVCVCHVGFKGVRCELSDCDQYCVLGNCSTVDGKPRCSCFDGWAGDRCEEPVCFGNNCVDQDNVHHLNFRYRAAILVCAAIVLCLVVITVFLLILLIRAKRHLHLVANMNSSCVNRREMFKDHNGLIHENIFSPAFSSSLPLCKRAKNNKQEDEKFLLDQASVNSNTHV